MNETTKKDPTKKTVLVIEDHKMISDTLRFQLLSKFNVDIAMNGKEAFSYLSSQMPDLIVMDLMLPDTSGFVLCGKIRQVERFKKVPIIILSALTDKENVDKALSLGADDFVNKPYVGQELLSKIVLALLAEKQIYVKGRMKKCPQCGNYLLKATRVCRHCNNLFSEIDETEDSKFVISDAADENIQQEFSEDKRETLLSVAKLLLPKIKTIISQGKLPFHIIEPNHLQLIIKLINQSEDENFAPLQLLSDQNNLAPKIIPISNLSFFRSEKKMTSLEDIESNCGPESLTVLVILYLVFNSIYYPPAIDQKSNSAHAHRLFNLFYDKIWSHALGCGLFCLGLAKEKNWPQVKSFLCGLLHDVGFVVTPKIILDLAITDEKCFEELVLGHLSKHIHQKAGGMLLDKWGFTQWLKEVNFFHHQEKLNQEKTSEQEIITAVQFADRLTTSVGISLEEFDVPENICQEIAKMMEVDIEVIEQINRDMIDDVKIFQDSTDILREKK